MGVEPGAEADSPEGLGLRPEPDGSYTYVDPGRRFTAKITPDGRVQLADRWRRPSATSSQRGRCCGLPPEGVAGMNPLYGMPVPGLLELMFRLHGIDPTAAAKSHFLDRTRAFRTRLAIAWHLSNLKTRLADLRGELAAIWHDERHPAAERRRLLFERWDECDERFRLDLSDLPEDAVTVVDQARVDTAEAARDEIEAFIRHHLPAGSKQAYPRRELQSLNARRVSRDPFRPYPPAQPRAAKDTGTRRR